MSGFKCRDGKSIRLEINVTHVKIQIILFYLNMLQSKLKRIRTEYMNNLNGKFGQISQKERRSKTHILGR